MKHYTKEELDLYRNKQMSVLGKINCASHLKQCRQCAALLDELKSDDVLLAQLRESLQTFKRYEKPQLNRKSTL